MFVAVSQDTACEKREEHPEHGEQNSDPGFEVSIPVVMVTRPSCVGRDRLENSCDVKECSSLYHFERIYEMSPMTAHDK